MNGTRTALVLGATGGSGGEIARALLARGWKVRALNRDPQKAAKPGDGLEWVRGDSLDAASVARAASSGECPASSSALATARYSSPVSR